MHTVFHDIIKMMMPLYYDAYVFGFPSGEKRSGRFAIYIESDIVRKCLLLLSLVI